MKAQLEKTDNRRPAQTKDLMIVLFCIIVMTAVPIFMIYHG